VVGLWASIPSSLTAEAAALAGADYVVVDQQHGAVDSSAMLAMLQAIQAGGAAPLVRVARNEPFVIGNALDLGAAGVIVPMVEDGEQAARAVAACRYAPEGERSFGALRGGAAEPPLCLVMIETRAGLERAEEIAATPGLDGIYIGPSDLALTLGLQPTLRLEHPPVLEAIERVRAVCAGAGVLAGLHCLAAEDAAEHAGRFAMVTAGGDALHLQGALAAGLATARRT
jgi:4-hydroxy-2-oxoheptanedioate aldolase